MSSPAGSEDRAETAIGTLINSGIRRQIAELLMSFCTFAISWLLEISSEVSLNSEPTLPGSGLPEFWNTINPMELSLTRQRLRESTSGSHKLLLELARADRGESCPSPTSRWGACRLARARHEGPPPHAVGARGRCFGMILGGCDVC